MWGMRGGRTLTGQRLGAPVGRSPGLVGLPGQATATQLYYWLLARLSVTKVALIAYATPVVATIVGIPFLDEQGTVRTLMGSGVVVLGVVLAARARPRAPSEPPGEGPWPAGPRRRPPSTWSQSLGPSPPRCGPLRSTSA